ncbi:MAG: cobalamin biosynthesis protein [Oleiphilaceae bacterium]|nr:cobalamin biosynthesis protein [Oleiphilaceae bacterium]
MSVLVCLLALALDHWFGEPRRGHPVVVFGGWATSLERKLNRIGSPGLSLFWGSLATVLLVVPLVALIAAATWWLPLPAVFALDVVGLWLALSLRGLAEHGQAVAHALEKPDLELARAQVGRIVSRRTHELDETAVATAASESMLENGADAIFASLFWYLVAGLPGVVLHRAVNTLDAMWGYRNERFLYFGRFAARLDDVLNWMPARLTAISYALVGNTRLALHCWRRQAPGWDSPNGGPVMAAGAGALSVSLGGPALYGTGAKERPVLGAGPAASAASIHDAIRLVRSSVVVWLIVMIAVSLSFTLLTGAGH